MSITIVVGNPRSGSRTHTLAQLVATGLASSLYGSEGPDSPGIAEGASISVVDLADLGAALLAPGDARPAQARELVAGTDLLIVATPVYKATYTGLLKIFLDGYGPNGLAGVTAVGVVVSASPAHLLATDIHLRSLLVELGAAVPTRSLGVLESQLADSADLIAAFAADNARVLRALTAPQQKELL